ncbi:hypothetical protein BDW71DRAFT_23057 [Aspergillus fruticulosus]
MLTPETDVQGMDSRCRNFKAWLYQVQTDPSQAQQDEPGYFWEMARILERSSWEWRRGISAREPEFYRSSSSGVRKCSPVNQNQSRDSARPLEKLPPAAPRTVHTTSKEPCRLATSSSRFSSKLLKVYSVGEDITPRLEIRQYNPSNHGSPAIQIECQRSGQLIASLMLAFF